MKTQGSFRPDISNLQETRLYRPLEMNEQTCIFADPAEGGNFCAAVLVSKKHADFPMVYNKRVESSQFGHDLYKLAQFVKKRTGMLPTIAVERNTGQATIYVLQEYNYPSLFRMRVFDHTSVTESSKIGWTTTTATRTKMLDDFALTLRQGQIKIYDRETLYQLTSFVIKQKRGHTPRAEAESGKNDDLVISTAGAWQLYNLVPSFDWGDDITSEQLQDEREKWRFK